jgi:hypothetical protein
MRKRTLALALLLALTVAAPCAAGPAEIARAEQLHKEGIAAIRRWEFEAGRKAFSEAYALDARSAFLLDLGLSEIQADRPAEGLTHLRRYLALPEAKADDPKKTERVRGLMAEAEAKTAHLMVSAPAGSVLALDGRATSAPEGSPLDVMPGQHTVEVRTQGGATVARTIEAHPGETLNLPFDVHDSPAPQQPAPGVASPQPSPPLEPAQRDVGAGYTPPRSQTARYVTSGALLGAGIVGLALGGVFTAKAGDDQSRRTQASTMQSYCVQPPSTPSCTEESNAAHALASDRNTATLFFVGGAALAVAGVTSWFLWPKPRANVAWTVSPAALDKGGGLQLAGSF